MRLKEVRDIFHKELDLVYGKDEVDSFFFILIDSYYHVNRIELALNPEIAINKEEQEHIFKALHDLKKEKPIQYILGETNFFGLPFRVNNEVLIPRPETEELVQWILDSVKKDEELKILDIGTGSGCIAITLAYKIPKGKVFAMDVSTGALKIAEENAKLNNVEIVFIEADILSNCSSVFDECKFDVIVSNPPYVRKSEKAEIKNNVLENEPHLALFVDDDDALQFYKSICQFCVDNLKEKGLLFFEINEYLGDQMRELLREGNFNNIELKQDLFGKERMIKATK